MRFPVFIALSLFAAAMPASGSTLVRDADGHTVTIESVDRVVSIGGAVTEILYALGLEDRIVGVDTTSLYPAAALRDKPNVGYMRQLSAEGILGLRPSAILAVQGSGPKQVIETLSATGVPLAVIPDVYTEDGLIAKIRLVGQAMGASDRVDCLINAVTADFARLDELRGNVTKPVRVLFVMSFVNDHALAAGRNTAADAIIRLAGAVNAADGFDGYKALGDEAVIAAKPDVVLSIARGPDSLLADTVFANSGFALTPAAKRRAFIAMDGLYLLGFGPRTASAARDLATRLYPELAARAAATPVSDCHP